MSVFIVAYWIYFACRLFSSKRSIVFFISELNWIDSVIFIGYSLLTLIYLTLQCIH